MTDSFKGFGETAKGLSRNPLGIIALFIVLVYGFASLVTAFGSALKDGERLPLVYFLVIFPVLVLGVFAWLVSRHAGKLYSPGEYKDESNYVAVVASLAAATVRRPDSQAAPAEVDFQRIAAVAREIVPRRLSEPDSWRNRILWVDDRPENNVYERSAFEAVGVIFTLALSTQEALTQLKGSKYAAIISDMGRREGPREGYALLDTLRGQGDQTPFFIYAGSNLPAHRNEAYAHGAQGSTNDPQELFEMVSHFVLAKARKSA